jgi:pimeloyl-ACP methyl ester carboxylesterase
MSNTITPTVFYRTLNMAGLEIVYREAGPRDAPTVLLLHAFPSSSPRRFPMTVMRLVTASVNSA